MPSRANRAIALPRRMAERGAALLLAMVILTLVATLAAGMVWQFSRAIQVEGAERARTQSAWILAGALDWARLIVGEDRADVDHLGDVWAVPLAEGRLSTFLQAGRGSNSVTTANSSAEDEGPDAFLSGVIIDATSRWNLRNLIKTDDGSLVRDELQVLERLMAGAGAPSDLPMRLADALQAAYTGRAGSTLMPRSMRDLVWLGVDPAVITTLESFVTILPQPTKVNVNTASREVIAAVANVSSGQAQAIVEARQRTPFQDLGTLSPMLPKAPPAPPTTPGQPPQPAPPAATSYFDVKTTYFEIRGRLRLEDHTLEEVSLVERRGRRVRTLHHERVNRPGGDTALR